MKNNATDIGLANGLINISLVGTANGIMNNEQQISDVNTFIFTIRTTSTKTIVLPLVTTGTYNFWIDWGDGIKDFVRAYSQIYSGETVARTHTYPIALIDYTIKITGVCRGWSYFGLTSEQPKLKSIQQFGCLELIDDLTNGQQFANCTTLNLSNVSDTLKTTYLTSMNRLFYITNISKIKFINNWDVSKITNMTFMFNVSRFDDVITGWNVNSVTNMSTMFNSFFNQDINNWDVSNVLDIGGMFSNATNFNQPLSEWNVGAVTNMGSMFFNAPVFDQPIGSWNVSSVTNMSSMFNGATNFNQDIGTWNIGAVTNFTGFMSTKTPATFSTANLDAIYNGWSSRPSNSNLSISFGTANYTAAGAAGKAVLLSRGWTIVDGIEV